MYNREEVIEHLKAYVDCYSNRHSMCEPDCPLYGYGDCAKFAVEYISDALELLKEQEPRVITREKLKQFDGSPCWFESHGTYMGKEGFWIIPARVRTFYAGMIISYTSVLDGAAGYGELGLAAYNKSWRCWTARPTDEQRKAVKWE